VALVDGTAIATRWLVPSSARFLLIGGGRRASTATVLDGTVRGGLALCASFVPDIDTPPIAVVGVDRPQGDFMTANSEAPEAPRQTPRHLVEVRDDAAGLRGEISVAIARQLAPDLPEGAIIAHDIETCGAPTCPLCSTLLCPMDDHRHLGGPDGEGVCPWARCDAGAPTAAALVAARRRAVQSPSTAGATRAKAGAIGQLGPGVLPALAAVLLSLRHFLAGLAAGAFIAGRDVAGLDEAQSTIRQGLGLLGFSEGTDDTGRGKTSPTAEVNSVRAASAVTPPHSPQCAAVNRIGGPCNCGAEALVDPMARCVQCNTHAASSTFTNAGGCPSCGHETAEIAPEVVGSVSSKEAP
jgi:hypothetical protein